MRKLSQWFRNLLKPKREPVPKHLQELRRKLRYIGGLVAIKRIHYILTTTVYRSKGVVTILQPIKGYEESFRFIAEYPIQFKKTKRGKRNKTRAIR